MGALIEAPMQQLGVDISDEADVAIAISRTRRFLARGRVRDEDVYRMTTVVAELARNIVKYATRGTVTVSLTERLGELQGSIVAEDAGPGMADVAQALSDGFSTGGSLGMGLPGCRRMMDSFTIETDHGKGTIVRAGRRLGRS